MPPQITRLVLLTVLLIGSYVVMRSFAKPDSFGEFGHYRGAALSELADKPLSYAGMKACLECHGEVLDVLKKTPHNGISCESCHGPQLAHAKDPDKATGKHGETLCLRCHAFEPARPASQKQIKRADHFSDSPCAECHLPHNPKQEPK